MNIEVLIPIIILFVFLFCFIGLYLLCSSKCISCKKRTANTVNILDYNRNRKLYDKKLKENYIGILKIEKDVFICRKCEENKIVLEKYTYITTYNRIESYIKEQKEVNEVMDAVEKAYEKLNKD